MGLKKKRGKIPDKDTMELTRRNNIMNVLDLFGQSVVEEVRDVTIRDWDCIIVGKAKGVTADAVKEKLALLTKEQLETLVWMLPKVVDSTIHNFLLMFDKSKEIDLKVNTKEGIIERLQEETDGLYGELYSKRGWISRYSKERHEELT